MRTRLAVAIVVLAGFYVSCAQSSSVDRSSGNYLDVGKAKLYYEQCGSSGPSLVLLHDGLVHSITWDGMWKPLCAKYRVLRYDRRGYGRSDPATAPFVPEDDLVKVMRQVKMDRAVIVGNSSGAALALDFALDHPEMVDGLILIGPVVHGMPSSSYFLERGNKNDAPLEKDDVKGAALNWSKDRFLIANGHEDARKKLYEVLAEHPGNLKLGGQFEIRPSPPTVLRLAQIQAPTLILVGDADIGDVFIDSGAIDAALPIVWLEIWNDTGHLIQLERPQELVARLDKFVPLVERKEAAVAPEILQSYVGDYKFFQRTITLSMKNGRLALRPPDLPDKPIFAMSDFRFFSRSTGTELEFEKDASGKVTQLVIFNSDGNVIKCPRL